MSDIISNPLGGVVTNPIYQTPAGTAAVPGTNVDPSGSGGPGTTAPGQIRLAVSPAFEFEIKTVGKATYNVGEIPLQLKLSRALVRRNLFFGASAAGFGGHQIALAGEITFASNNQVRGSLPFALSVGGATSPFPIIAPGFTDESGMLASLNYMNSTVGSILVNCPTLDQALVLNPFPVTVAADTLYIKFSQVSGLPFGVKPVYFYLGCKSEYPI